MGLKKYILVSVVLIAAVFGYVFSMVQGVYTVTISDFSVTLPIATWVILPTAVLFAMTVLHILFYGLKNFLALKAITKDSESMITLLSKKLLNEESDVSFQSEQFKQLEEIISQLEINVNDTNFSSTNKTIVKAVDKIQNINAGKYISEKDLKLGKENPLMINNTINRIKEDENFALEAVKRESNYPRDIVKFAFQKMIDTKSMTTIKKHIDEIDFDKDMIISLFKKDSEQKPEFALSSETILKLIENGGLTNSELIRIAQNYKKSMTPDQIIDLYEHISAFHEDYMVAYLFVLSEFEMIDKIRDILVNSSTNDYTAFKALVDLKDAGKHTYSLETLCYK